MLRPMATLTLLVSFPSMSIPGLASRRTSGAATSPAVTRSGTMPSRVRSFPSRCISSRGCADARGKRNTLNPWLRRNVMD